MKHNFPKGISYVTINRPLTDEEVKEIFYLAIDTNIPIGSETIRRRVNPDYPHLSFSDAKLINVQRIDDDDLSVTFEEFKQFMQGKGTYTPPFEEELQLNSNHTATVTKKGIRVGCQVFTHETIDTLYELSKKARSC